MIIRPLFPYLAGITIAIAAGTLLVRLSAVDADGLRSFPLPFIAALVALVAITLLGVLVLLLAQLDERRPVALLNGAGLFAVAALCLAGTPLLVLPALGTTALFAAWARRPGRP